MILIKLHWEQSKGALINVSDADNVGSEDVISYAEYNGQERLTIDIGFETVNTTSTDNVTQLTQVSGFEECCRLIKR